MTKAEDDIHCIEIPEAIPPEGTIEMVSLLGSLMEAVAASVPFPFTCGDLMSAHLKSSFEVGLCWETDPQALHDRLVNGLGAILADVLETRRKLN